MITLLGLLIIVVGFALRANALLVVITSAIVTGMLSGMSLNQVVEQLGKLFVDNRYMTLPVILIVPVIGLLESHGLRERAETLIRRIRNATAGRVLFLYCLIRQISIALGVNIGGHAGAVRPIVAPMAEGAAHAKHGALPEKATETIRAHAAAAENIGNFFGEDIFIAVGAVLLMKGFFEAQDLEVSVWALALWGIPTAMVAALVMAWRARTLDRRLAQMATNNTAQNKPEVKT
jgi:uncharacterized membrane protein